MKSATPALSALLLALAAAPLAGQTPYTLDTLHVTVGSRTDPRLPSATRSVEVLTADDIQRLPALTLADVLGWALGVDVLARSPAQADVGIRGSSAEQVLVLVDGARATDPQTAHFALDQAVPLDDVERIEILRGPASALYGADALGGVINIVTRSGGGVTARAEGGSFGSGTAALRVGGGSAGARGHAAAEFQRSDGFRPGTDVRAVQLRGGGAVDVAGRALRADVGWAARDFGARAFYTPPAAPYDEYEKTRTASLVLGWEAPAAARLAVTPRVSIRRHDDDFVLKRDDPSFYENVHRSWQAGAEVVGRWATSGARVAWGVEGQRDILRSSSLGDREESRAAAFGEVSVGEVGRAVLTGGLREDWHSRYGAFLAPSLAGAVWAGPALRLRASAGRAFRAPTWTDRYYRDPSNVGDPELRPERAWAGEAGADVVARNGARLSLTGFVRRATDLIDWVRDDGAPPTSPWFARNLGRVTFRGVELEGSVAGPLDTRWTARATALSLRADEAASGSKYALRPLDRTASLAFDRALGRGFGFGARTAYERRVGEPGHWLVDARLRAGWRDVSLYLDGRNLTDARYLDVSGTTAPGRALYVGAEWTRRGGGADR
ncbi:MAG: TonB-dependent receptor [Gemmatimonadetes bacterium]|nr:TonB-dependent receptor [Gemmatimonadota bacterium]